MVTQIVKSKALQSRFSGEGPPCRPPTLLMTLKIYTTVLAGWKHEMIGIHPS